MKIWSVDDRSYVETLFGHNDKISAVDAGTRERAVTAGHSLFLATATISVVVAMILHCPLGRFLVFLFVIGFKQSLYAMLRNRMFL